MNEHDGSVKLCVALDCIVYRVVVRFESWEYRDVVDVFGEFGGGIWRYHYGRVEVMKQWTCGSYEAGVP